MTYFSPVIFPDEYPQSGAGALWRHDGLSRPFVCPDHAWRVQPQPARRQMLSLTTLVHASHSLAGLRRGAVYAQLSVSARSYTHPRLSALSPSRRAPLSPPAHAPPAQTEKMMHCQWLIWRRALFCDDTAPGKRRLRRQRPAAVGVVAFSAVSPLFCTTG